MSGFVAAGASDQPKKGLYGGLGKFVAAGASTEESIDPIKEGDKLNEGLEKEFEEARQRIWSGNVRGGLGFADNSGKKIDTTAAL